MPKPRDYTVPRCCRPTDALLFLLWTNVMEVYVLNTHLQCAGGSRGGAKGCSSTGVRQAQQALAVSCVCVDQSCLSFTVS